MKCRSCKEIELTSQEEHSKKQICYFCLKDYLDKVNDLSEETFSIPPPEDFGRSKEEVARYDALRESNKNLSQSRFLDDEDLDSTEPATMKDIEGLSDVVDDKRKDELEMKQRKRNQQLSNAESKSMFNLMRAADDPPIEVEVALSDDFFVKFCFPAPLPEKQVRQLEEIARQIIRDMVFFKLHGTIFERYLTDPDAPKPQMGPGF
jgi:hypothetical protein